MEVVETEQTKIIFFSMNMEVMLVEPLIKQNNKQTNKQKKQQANYFSSVVMSSMLTSQQ